MADNSILIRLDGLKLKYEEIGQKLTDPEVIADVKQFIQLTKEYKEMVARAKKARAALKKESKKSVVKKSAKAGRRQDGHLDQRTKAGKEAAARMAAARKAKGS